MRLQEQAYRAYQSPQARGNLCYRRPRNAKVCVDFTLSVYPSTPLMKSSCRAGASFNCSCPLYLLIVASGQLTRICLLSIGTVAMTCRRRAAASTTPDPLSLGLPFELIKPAYDIFHFSRIHAFSVDEGSSPPPESTVLDCCQNHRCRRSSPSSSPIVCLIVRRSRTFPPRQMRDTYT